MSYIEEACWDTSKFSPYKQNKQYEWRHTHTLVNVVVELTWVLMAVSWSRVSRTSFRFRHKSSWVSYTFAKHRLATFLRKKLWRHHKIKMRHTHKQSLHFKFSNLLTGCSNLIYYKRQVRPCNWKEWFWNDSCRLINCSNWTSACVVDVSTGAAWMGPGAELSRRDESKKRRRERENH